MSVFYLPPKDFSTVKTSTVFVRDYVTLYQQQPPVVSSDYESWKWRSFWTTKGGTKNWKFVYWRNERI